MTEETNNTNAETPQENIPSDEEIKEVAQSVPGPTTYQAGEAEAMRERMTADDDEVTPLDAGVAEAVAVSEELSETAPVQAWDAGVKSIQAGLENLTEPPHTPEGAHSHAHGETTVFLGREYPIPIYTSVFIALGVLTVVEVLIAEIISGDIKIPFMLAIAIVKATLVVMFYMHLNTDSRIFAVTLAVPLVIALLGTLFLLGIPAA